MTEMIILNPEVFDPKAVATDTARFNKMVEDLMARMPPIHKMTPQKVREDRESGKGWMGPVKRLDEAKDRVVPGLNRDVSVRVVVPDEVRGVYLHIHGGGFVLMRPYHFDETLVETVSTTYFTSRDSYTTGDVMYARSIYATDYNMTITDQMGTYGLQVYALTAEPRGLLHGYTAFSMYR